MPDQPSTTTTSQRRRASRAAAASPSPPPPAPVAQTPGPRASRLQAVFEQALGRTLRANSFNNFSGCFPTPATHVPGSLESVWRQLNAKLEESAKAEFEDILHERDAIGQLNELDRLVGEARFRRDNAGRRGGEGEGEVVAPHTLSPDELYKARLAPYLQEAQEALDVKIETTHAQNEELSQKVQSQRMEIDALLKNLEAVVGDLEGAAAAASQFTSENDLRKDAIQMEEELGTRSEK